MFSGNKHANTTAKKPVIRREKVLVPVKQPPTNGAQKPAAPPPGGRFKLSTPAKAATPAAPRSKAKPKAPAVRALAASEGRLKRKSTTPDRVDFSDEEDEAVYSSEVGTSDSEISRKRLKSNADSARSLGPRRDLVLRSAFETREDKTVIEGADVTSGAIATKFKNSWQQDTPPPVELTSGAIATKFKNPWQQDTFHSVELQYPTNSPPERFELKWPKNETDDYKPMEDITETINMIVESYFPDDLYREWSNDQRGFARLFNRAWKKESVPEFISIVEEFNSVLKPLIDNGTIQAQLANKRNLSFDFVQRILDQITSRTVSPQVEILKAYQNGTDNVYGELLPRFCTEIFDKTNLNHEQVFIDLGSGVGNVVLQAALEIGCESWGIEMMPNPCYLAELQAKEFGPRTRLWGIDAGAVTLRRGDFTKDPEIAKVLKRADVVLVNNQAFTPSLNDKLLDMFLDLKDGCQVVSLKPFVQDGHKITSRNISSVANLFVQTKHAYHSKRVSWSDGGGSYYIATKDPRPLNAFIAKHGSS